MFIHLHAYHEHVCRPMHAQRGILTVRRDGFRWLLTSFRRPAKFKFYGIKTVIIEIVMQRCSQGVHTKIIILTIFGRAVGNPLSVHMYVLNQPPKVARGAYFPVWSEYVSAGAKYFDVWCW